MSDTPIAAFPSFLLRAQTMSDTAIAAGTSNTQIHVFE